MFSLDVNLSFFRRDTVYWDTEGSGPSGDQGTPEGAPDPSVSGDSNEKPSYAKAVDAAAGVPGDVARYADSVFLHYTAEYAGNRSLVCLLRLPGRLALDSLCLA